MYPYVHYSIAPCQIKSADATFDAHIFGNLRRFWGCVKRVLKSGTVNRCEIRGARRAFWLCEKVMVFTYNIHDGIQKRDETSV